jgi:cytochrome oxidase assembly protein ShyY1
VLATLRQRRYLGLLAVALLLATVCGVLGSWQVARLAQKHSANRLLRDNDRAATADVTAVLGPALSTEVSQAARPATTGTGGAASTGTGGAASTGTGGAASTGTGGTRRLRHVTATGEYLTGDQTLVRGQTVNGDVGYLVLTPLRTAGQVLLVVRGFLRQTGVAERSPTVPPPPAGTVTVQARVQPGSQRPDRFGALPGAQVESVNPGEVTRRLGRPVWDAYAELLAGQPGAAGLTPIPDPDLSNPAGGADEPQHAAYVAQWYLFGLLALAAPFAMAAAEHRRDAEADPERVRPPSLDDRLAGRA